MHTLGYSSNAATMKLIKIPHPQQLPRANGQNKHYLRDEMCIKVVLEHRRQPTGVVLKAKLAGGKKKSIEGFVERANKEDGYIIACKVEFD